MQRRAWLAALAGCALGVPAVVHAASATVAAAAAAAAAADQRPASAAAAAPLLVIAGASGQTGRRILQSVPAGRYRVRALSADLARARRELGRALYARAEWHQVDIRDAAAVKPALDGATYVISAIGARMFEGAASPQFIDYQANVNLVDAARAAGARHFVMVSSASAGSHRDQSQVPRLGHVLLYKTQAEEHLKASGLGYTILGPAGLLNTPARRDGLEIVPRAAYASTNVSRADVARVALDALDNPDAGSKSFALVGDRRGDPEAWRTQLRTLPRDDRGSLEALDWMTGHWRSGDGEELWLAPRGGLMLGLNREVRAGRPAAFEYLRIEARADGALVYLASPGGRDATPFRLTTLGPRRAVFTNPSHDFPKILTYWREGETLRARADGVEGGKRMELEHAWTAADP
jgi:uncharacterized protein YbjT (DUF2867 family)